MYVSFMLVKFADSKYQIAQIGSCDKSLILVHDLDGTDHSTSLLHVLNSVLFINLKQINSLPISYF